MSRVRDEIHPVDDLIDLVGDARIDPAAADRARHRYACFDHLDDQAYGAATVFDRKEPCEDAVVAQLRELRDRAAQLAGRDGRTARGAYFTAEQNAKLATDAEHYYRAMFRSRAGSCGRPSRARWSVSCMTTGSPRACSISVEGGWARSDCSG